MHGAVDSRQEGARSGSGGSEVEEGCDGDVTRLNECGRRWR